MEVSSTVSYTWEARNGISMPSLNLSLTNNIQVDEEIEEDEVEEVEVDENERLHLQKVSSLVEAAYQRVEKFSKRHFYISSAAASEGSSCASTVHQPASLPDSLDGGKGEVEELKNLPATFETGLRVNQALQRRMSLTLSLLEKTLQENLVKQAQLKEEEEEQNLINAQSKDYREARDKYLIRASSFAVPYFKDRTGMPAPMNQDAKFKVDHGYLDLYSTRLRTWLTSEQNLLVKQVQKEWKEHLINDWKSKHRDAERKLKNELSDNEKKEVEEEINTCLNHISFFTNVSADKIDIPRGASLDWDKISAQTYDGHRSTEECQLLWENFMHPNINRSSWKEEEDIEIQDSVLKAESKNLKPNWRDIAASLGTGRTEFQVMQRWVAFIKPTIQPARWTSECSKKLEDTLNMLRVGSHIPWARVAQHLPGYTKVQLQSRWRHINPDQSKGPFTVEEDFVLIKGVYRFGMNFDLIAHFMPGRSRVQVRERFKRSILPGLTSHPWHWKEDKKIIMNCSMDDQRWRTMALLLPKRDSCQIRLRFYILHFWQTISDENKLPPPLFPLSSTTKSSEIKKLREKIAKLTPDVNIYLDSIQSKKEDNVGSVRLFEERRATIVKNQNKRKLEKFLEEKPDEPIKPKVIRKKRRGWQGPRNQSWPDNALTEFFLPGRFKANARVELDPEDADLGAFFHAISQAMQIRVKKAVTENELKRLEEHVLISVADANLVNQVLLKQHRGRNYNKNCLACIGQNPDIIPLMAPTEATTGAFKSLLKHKPKLEEMSSKEFLLFQVPRTELHKLGKKPRTLNVTEIGMKVELPNDKVEITSQNNQLRATKYCESEEENSCSDEETNFDITSGGRKKRRAAAMANIVNYVVSQEERKPKLLREPRTQKEVLNPPSEDELQAMFVQGETPSFRKRHVDEPVQNIIKQEDSLLFHRMLSLFFWPALFTLTKPSKEAVYVASELARESLLDESKIPDELAFDRGAGSLSHLDIAEQEAILKKMEAVKTEKKIRYRTIGLNYKPAKPDVEITQEDMDTRIYSKFILKYKRSLIMRKAWGNRRQGIINQKQEGKSKGPAVRKSTRLASRHLKLKADIEREEEEEHLGIDQEREEND